ncbi:MAG: hypothetical protein H0X12_13525 [Nocardioides sp.]|nr:hypothetical protein [Nocardioides sp.]
MPYLNLDDNFSDHPKVDTLSDGAFRLHVAGLCYCAKNTTNGVVERRRVPRLTSTYKASLLKELMDAGLWMPHTGGYEIHDYLDWNKSKDWWDRKRAEDAKRKQKWREAQAAKEGEDS